MESRVTYCLCGQPYEKGQFMVECDCCKEWYHGQCVDVKEYNSFEIDKYHCPRCVHLHGPSIMRPYINWHRHEYWDPQAVEKPVQTGTGVFIKELCSRHFASEGEIVTHMRGQQLTENFLMQNGFNNPIVIDGKDGLDITIPPEHFSIYDVEQCIGSDKNIDVIDVMRQTDFKMSLRAFVEYFNNPKRNRVLNCISLEFSATGLSRYVEAPLIARSLDWVNTVWPRDLPEDIHTKPRVQKYCLMSVKDSYTDFHIDFGGTSVWYHILRGEKIFYFIRPTTANLTLYQQWMTSSTQNETFFGDQVDQCYKCTLRQGQTMLIPTGWIHAVLTTEDSLVFGGNFLHSLNIPMQLQVYEIEKKIKVAAKFKYPAFEAINWYAAKKIMTQLKEINTDDKKCPAYFLAGIKSLLAVLKQWNTDKDYNMSNREQIPDVINSHKLLKDLGKEVRQAERYINSLNPPKPERESKRKRKKPVNKDFVDFSQPVKNYEILDPIMPKPKAVSQRLAPKTAAAKQAPTRQNQKLNDPNLRELNRTLAAAHSHINMSLSTSGPDYPYEGLQSGSASSSLMCASAMPPPSDRTWNEYPLDPNERWVVTNVNGGDRPGVLKFTLGSKDSGADSLVHSSPDLQDYSFTSSDNGAEVFDFNDDRDDEFALRIDESPTKKRKAAPKKAQNPKNGIESLLKASALTNKLIDSGRASPSTREAIAGMLSIGQTYSLTSGGTFNTPTKAPRRRRASPPKDHFEENIRNVHQDDEYIYPSLDNSDEEETYIFKPRGRSKVDEAWNPKARVGPLLPKMNRPAREGTKRQAVEKVLEAAAAKRASEPTVIETHQKRAYRKKKLKSKLPSTPDPGVSSSLPTNVSTASGSFSGSSGSKPKKGMKTAKQRLGKILKIHKMIY